MATPTLVTVTGHIAGQGTVTFVRHRPLVSASGDTVIPAPASPTIAYLDENGDFEIQLYATNDPAWLPVDLAYSVRVNAGGGARGSMLLDYQATAVDFDDVFQPGTSAEAGRSYLDATQLGRPGGVAQLDEDGYLTAGQVPPDVGLVDSVNGQTGAVVLDAGDVGAEPAGAVAAITLQSLGIYVGSATPVGAVDGDIWFDTSGA